MHLSSQGLLVIIIVGIIAGWLAGRVIEGGGFGLIGDLLVGLVGAFIGDWLLPRLDIHLGQGIVALIMNAFIGAVVLLLILRLVGGGLGLPTRLGLQTRLARALVKVNHPVAGTSRRRSTRPLAIRAPKLQMKLDQTRGGCQTGWVILITARSLPVCPHEPTSSEAFGMSQTGRCCRKMPFLSWLW
jgi:uncharacterized membrane protein YeaQ/YmgE (transglycosylase-associated protein family)